jgi:hypothetical protein
VLGNWIEIDGCRGMVWAISTPLTGCSKLCIFLSSRDHAPDSRSLTLAVCFHLLLTTIKVETISLVYNRQLKGLGPMFLWPGFIAISEVKNRFIRSAQRGCTHAEAYPTVNGFDKAISYPRIRRPCLLTFSCILRLGKQYIYDKWTCHQLARLYFFIIPFRHMPVESYGELAHVYSDRKCKVSYVPIQVSQSQRNWIFSMRIVPNYAAPGNHIS